jgi:hypothetical protein
MSRKYCLCGCYCCVCKNRLRVITLLKIAEMKVVVKKLDWLNRVVLIQNLKNKLDQI